MHLFTLVSSNEETRVNGDTPCAIAEIMSRKRTGAVTVPCGTPDMTGLSSDITPSTTTACCLCLESKKAANHIH